MMFITGDRIRHKDTGYQGEIKKVNCSMDRPGPGQATIIYTLKWDHFNNDYNYMHEDVENEWELVSRTVFGDPSKMSGPVIPKPKEDLFDALSYAVKYYNSMNIGGEYVECNHSWKVYDSGFSRYEYCEHCNKKRDER